MMASEKRLIAENDIYALFGRKGKAELHVADIDLLPRADAVEVVHGRWVARKICGGSTIFKCSECSREVQLTNDYFGKPSNHVAEYYPYCHCGAKMDGERKDNG